MSIPWILGELDFIFNSFVFEEFREIFVIKTVRLWFFI
jgi:hypothetical protein